MSCRFKGASQGAPATLDTAQWQAGISIVGLGRFGVVECEPGGWYTMYTVVTTFVYDKCLYQTKCCSSISWIETIHNFVQEEIAWGFHVTVIHPACIYGSLIVRGSTFQVAVNNPKRALLIRHQSLTTDSVAYHLSLTAAFHVPASNPAAPISDPIPRRRCHLLPHQ